MKNQVTFLKNGCIAFVVLILNLFLVTSVFSQTIRPEKVVKAIYSDKSQELRNIPVVSPELRDRSWKDGIVKNKHGFHDDFKRPSFWTGKDPVLQDQMPSERSNPIIYNNFPGTGNISGVAPPDPDGDVGPNHYFQMVNLVFAIWDKNENLLYGPADNSTLWDGFDGPWSGTNNGDPIILYDEYADRWVASQFALPNYPNGPFYELVAVSETGDPLGSWYRYAYEFSNMPDYPKFGVWSDGYYFTINQFAPPYLSWAGGGVCVLDRDAMLSGDPNAEMIFFNLGTSYGSLLPADCDGPTLPPSGSSSYFAETTTSTLRVWEADIDWNNTNNSSVSIAHNLPVQSYSYSGITINQPGTSTTLMEISDRLMYRLQYRNFGSYQVMLTNHTVNADGNGQAGVRWYELRNYGSGWSIHQQGTYAPDDGENRWMASIAMNGDGDIALGYSVSSSSTYPSIRFAGQNAESSGTGVLDIPETSIKEGTASQTGINRWGDYSSMTIDPEDDETFWYTTEYTTGGWNWKTQIASFSYAPIVDPPIADFNADDTHPMQGQTVQFMDMSSSVPNTWNWSFSPFSVSFVEGTNAGSKNPKVQFNTAGFYTVTLIATNDIGTDTEIKTDYINTLDCTPITTYPYLQTFDEWAISSPEMSCTSDGTVMFDDCWMNGNGDDIDWDILSDNTASGDTGPSEDHTGGGNYIFTESSSCYNSTGYVISAAFNLTSLTNPELRFWQHMYGSSMGTMSVQVSTNGGYSWSSDIWSLTGDQGNQWNEVVIPLGSYSSSTNFKIRFVGATGSNWHSDMAIDDISIDGSSSPSDNPPVADFSADNLTPTTAETVNFTDLSTNNPTSWLWTFTPSTITYMGGANSSSQNPQIRFDASDTYTVALTVTNGSGSDTETKTNYINATMPLPMADFSADNLTPTTAETVNFTDLSTNDPTSWSWTFTPSTIIYMGGTNSSSQNPQIRFDAPGTYTIMLTATNGSGSNTETKTNYINTTMPLPMADFSANNLTPTTAGIVNFTDLSINAPTDWSWSFDPSSVTFVNGTSASSQNPQLSFDVAGTYDVTLTATNANGSDSETKTAYIVATDLPPFSLPWIEDFEDVGTTTYAASSSSIDGLPEWSYEKTANGRLRYTAGSGFYYSGTHAATIDAYPSGAFSVNYLIATLNLSAYATSNELELSFSYMHHGEESHANDRVWIRGSSSDSWIQAYDLYSNKGSAGTWNTITGLDIDNLLSSNGQSPSASFQIRFGQEDNYPATRTTASDGFTFDDINVEEIDPSAYIICTFPYSQSWETGIGLWKQGTSDDFDWTRDNGGTPSSSTGPTGAQDGTYYMYTEASSPRANGDEAHLEATFDFSSLSSPIFSFYYHMYGISIASLHVDIFDGSWNNSVWVVNGPQQNAQSDPYEQAVIDLSSWEGQNNIIIRFRGIVGSGAGATYYSDIAIDMIDVVGGTVTEPPAAEFTADDITIGTGGSVQFTDLSTNSPTEWLWSFEGGTPTISADQNPSVMFNDIGTYTIELTATNGVGSDIEIKTAYITVVDPPVAEFIANNTVINEGESVQFTDQSLENPTLWTWTFNGGSPSSSADQNPSVTFDTQGIYTVELTASNTYGSDTETKVGYIIVNDVIVPPEAEFIADITTINAGESVQFTDLSTDATSWSWSFAGGSSSDSTAQNPSVIYNAAGTYTVSLIATNGEGSDIEIKTDYITVSSIPLTEIELSFSDFESGWGIWTDGGDDCKRYICGPFGLNYAWSGIAAANIQDNSGVASSFYMTNGADVHSPGYVQIDVEFYFTAVSMDNPTEDFWVQYYDGISWHTVATFAQGIDFDNNNFYIATVSILESDYNFPTDMKIRFMCDADSNLDDIYIDDIKISASTQLMQNSSLDLVEELQPLRMFAEDIEIDEEIRIYPNPAKDKLNIVSKFSESMEVSIYSITGQLVYYKDNLDKHELIDIRKFDKGMYIVKVRADGDVITKKIIKQ